VEVSGLSGTHGFSRGINLFNARNINIDNVRILGDRDGAPPSSAIGLRIGGDSDAVEFFFRKLQVYFVDTAVYGHGNCEGMYFSQCVTVACGVGVDWQSPSSNPLFQWIGGHINTSRRGIRLVNIDQWDISHCLIYGQAGSFAGTDYTGVEVSTAGPDRKNSRFVNNTLRGLTSVPKNAVHISGTLAEENILFDGNLFIDFDAAIILSADTDDVTVTPTNRFVGVTTRVLDQTGDASANYIVRTTWSDSTVVTLVGGATTESITVALRPGLFATKPTYASIVEGSGLAGIQGRYLFDSSSSTETQAHFELYRTDGLELPAGAVRLGVFASGT
jgi:hypothetical protein